jgi:hypothetical protein
MAPQQPKKVTTTTTTLTTIRMMAADEKMAMDTLLTMRGPCSWGKCCNYLFFAMLKLNFSLKKLWFYHI